MTTLSDPYPILPFTRPLSGSVALPGSKSVSNRVLLMAAMSNRTVTLHDMLLSRDTEIMMCALETLGFSIQVTPGARQIVVEGKGGRIDVDEASIHVGNAGTAARLITAFLATKERGTFHLDGDAAMRRRPMRGLLDALQRMEAASVTYHGEPGFFPFTLKTHGYPGGSVQADASESSQILSALMLALPFAAKDTTVHVLGDKMRKPYVVMTLDMMEQFGQAGACDFSTMTFTVNAGCPYPDAPANYVVEPDASAASYFLALPAVTGGQLAIEGLGAAHLQGDLAYADVLERAGLRIQRDLGTWIIQHSGNGIQATETNFYDFSDTFLTHAVLATLADGPTLIEGLAHTRHQETDRVAAMANELRKLGLTVDETEGSLRIHPNREAMRAAAANGPISIHTYEDHRIAMSFGILGSLNLLGDGRPWLAIEDPLCCKKTFPAFFDVLESLRQSTVSA